MGVPYPVVRVQGNPQTDWTPPPPRVECPECGAEVHLARVMEGEHQGEWVLRAHQTPTDSGGCISGIVFDLETTPRPMYREDGGER